MFSKFLAVQNSSIGDLVTHWLTDSLTNSWGQTGRKLRTRQHGLLTQLSVKPQQWLPAVMRMISTPLFIPSVLSLPECLAARVWPLHSNSLLEILSVSLWILWGRGHIQLLSQQRKRRKVSQQKDVTRKGDWNSLAGRKPSPLQVPFCLCQPTPRPPRERISTLLWPQEQKQPSRKTLWLPTDQRATCVSVEPYHVSVLHVILFLLRKIIMFPKLSWGSRPQAGLQHPVVIDPEHPAPSCPTPRFVKTATMLFLIPHINVRTTRKIIRAARVRTWVEKCGKTVTRLTFMLVRTWFSVIYIHLLKSFQYCKRTAYPFWKLNQLTFRLLGIALVLPSITNHWETMWD